jgi:carboxylesterase
VEALVTVPGAEPWSAAGSEEWGETGVVLVHGLTSSPVVTRPLGQRLAAEGYAVEVVLLPGHGTSHRDLARTRYADWFGSVEHTVEHLRHSCRRIVLVGHSMGGTIGLDLASRRPDAVHGLAVVNPSVLAPHQPLARFGPVLQHVLPYLPRDVAGMPTDDIRRPGVREHAYALVSTKATQSFLRELPRIRAQLPDLTHPLLVVWSTEDHTVAPDNGRALRELVGSEDVTELELERSYHLPMLDYDAPRLEEEVVRFVAGIAKA